MWGTTEDLSGYTETDPNSRITVSATRATAASLTRQEDAYVCKDKGANWFSGSFKHRVTGYVTSIVNGGWLTLWGVTNAVDDFYWQLLNGPALWLDAYQSGTTVYLELFEAYGGSNYKTTYVISTATPYYIEIERNESVGTYGTLYLRVYSDSARTTLLTTLSLTLHAKVDFRYLFALGSYNSGVSNAASGYAENLDLNERWTAAGRGDHAVLTSRQAAGRGLHMAIYAQWGLHGRGAHAAYNSFPAGGRGAHAVTVLYPAAGRGTHALLQQFPASGRGLHLSRNTFTGGGRGKHAVCVACLNQGRGFHRVANTALANYELYRGVDGPADLTGAPWETFSGLPHVSAALAASHEYHFVLRLRNAWGLVSQNLDEWIVTVDASGNQVLLPPSAPEAPELTVTADLKVRVRSDYLYAYDGDLAGSQFLVYLTSNGVDPNPAVDTPTAVAMVKADGTARLDWSSAVFVSGTVVKVLLRTRRVITAVPDVHSDSENVDVHQVTATLPAMATPAPSVWFAKVAEQAQ